jgi:hypothetical protein
MGKGLISPLFHEGAQNLRATPPCAVLILPPDFDPQAMGTDRLSAFAAFWRGRLTIGSDAAAGAGSGHSDGGGVAGWRVDPQRGHPAAVARWSEG